ncbi:universal stress protein [Psychromonas sp. GE-S-Ul-11]|uniref:universal stress protein n=1 Tax=Psychromonas sp. GE-S-Ul-11 TaxID=3241170 RepID=UPI00390C84A7
MSYRHILVTVDFEEDNQLVIDKGINLAKSLDAKLSLVHVNQLLGEYGFTGLMDLSLAGLAAYPDLEELTQQLKTLASELDYDIAHTYVVNGDISHSLETPVKEAGIDLIICGHHHDFWSRVSPTVGGLVNTSSVDLLIVALIDK